MLPKTEIQVDSDEELILNAQNGCAESISLLIRRYERPLRSFVARRVGDLQVADDLAQEVFIAAFLQLSRLSKTGSFQNWLLTIARNKIVDHLRQLTRERKTVEQLIALKITRQCSSRVQRTSLVESEEIHDALRQCISKLGSQGQTLVKKYYFENATAESIGRDLGQKGNSIRMALLRIRKKLAACIRERTELEL
jgi:RNA polymerase sigma-70 factor (ECF subfamily)